MTKGVEDGMSDEQHYACVMEGVTHATNGFYAMCHTAGCYWSTHTDCMTKEEAQRAAEEHSAKLSATPEELTSQAESLNYKSGPRQAVPFMPQVATEPRWTEVCDGKHEPPECSDCYLVYTTQNINPAESPEELPPCNQCASHVAEKKAYEMLIDGLKQELRLRSVPVEERTILPQLELSIPRATTATLMIIKAATDLELKNRGLIPALIPEESTAEMEQLMDLLRRFMKDCSCPCGDCTKCTEALDHIEGKAKAESQEVQEDGN